jgi:ABC-type spermidine/putrescine transport system permease subunit II
VPPLSPEPEHPTARRRGVRLRLVATAIYVFLLGPIAIIVLTSLVSQR